MKLVHNCCSQFSLVKICYVKSDIRKTKICFTNFAASDNYTSALSQDSHRCIGLNVYERSKKIFLEDRKINVCQLNWPAGWLAVVSNKISVILICEDSQIACLCG